MIYVCIPSFDEAPTIGLLLWKIRKVFTEFPREYQLLVADDGSTDGTAELLEPYAKVLPLTVVRHGSRQGYGPSLEELLRLAVERTDRPKRDCAVIMHADFAHGPHYLPDLIRQIESGADLVIAEASGIRSVDARARRWARRAAPHLLGGRAKVPGVHDTVSGYAALRLVMLRNALRDVSGPLITTEGWVANAELYARVAHFARRIETIKAEERLDLRGRPSRRTPWESVRALWRGSRSLRVPQAQLPKATVAKGPPQPAEVA